MGPSAEPFQFSSSSATGVGMYCFTFYIYSKVCVVAFLLYMFNTNGVMLNKQTKPPTSL